MEYAEELENMEEEVLEDDEMDEESNLDPTKCKSLIQSN